MSAKIKNNSIKKLSKKTPDQIKEILLGVTTDNTKDPLFDEYIEECLKIYVPTIEDIEKNPVLLVNDHVFDTIENLINDGNFAEYINHAGEAPTEAQIELINRLILNNRITAQYELLEKYHILQHIDKYIDRVINSGDKRAYVYSSNPWILRDGIENEEFFPTIEMLQQYPNLCTSDAVILYVINNNPKTELDKIMSLCKVNELNASGFYKKIDSLGYKATFDKLKENPYLATAGNYAYEILDNIEDIEKINEFLRLFKILNDPEIIDLLIEKGYKFTAEDLDKQEAFAMSDTFFMKILNKSNCSLIEKYKGKSSRVFQRAFDLGYKIPIKTILNNQALLQKSAFCKYVMDTNPKLTEEILRIKFSQDLLVYAIDKKYIDFSKKTRFNKSIMESKHEKVIEVLEYYYPNGFDELETNNFFHNLIGFAIKKGLIRSKSIYKHFTSFEDRDVLEAILKREPRFALGLKEISDGCIKVLTKTINNGKFIPTEEELEQLPEAVFDDLEFVESIVRLNVNYIKYEQLDYYDVTDLYNSLALDNIFLSIDQIREWSRELQYRYFRHDNNLFDKLWDVTYDNEKFLLYALHKGYVPENPTKYTEKYEIIHKMYKLNNGIYDVLTDDQKYMIDIMNGKVEEIDLSLLGPQYVEYEDLLIKILKSTKDAISSSKIGNKTSLKDTNNMKYFIELALYGKNSKIKNEIIDLLKSLGINIPKDFVYAYSNCDYDLLANLEMQCPGLIEYLYSKKYIVSFDKHVLDIIVGKEPNYDINEIFERGSSSIYKSNLLFLKVISDGLPNVISYYAGSDIEIFEKAKKSGANVTSFLKNIFYINNSIKLKEELINLLKLDFLKGKAPAIKEKNNKHRTDYFCLIEALKIYPDFVNELSEEEKELISLVIGPKESQYIENYNGQIITEIDEILEIMDINPNIIYAYYGSDIRVFEKALQLGVSKDILFNVGYRFSKNKSFINSLMDLLELKFPEKYQNYLQNYKFNRYLFVTNIDTYLKVLSSANIDIDKFEQYEFGNSYDWMKDIMTISNDLDNFLQVKEYFFKHFYKIQEYDIQLTIVNCFENLLKNYVKYKSLCLDIINKDLTSKEFDNLLILFSKDTTSEFIAKIPEKTEDLDSIDVQIIEDYNRKLDSLSDKPINELKDFLCKVLFDKNAKEINKFLSNYGTSVDFRQLVFNNRNNRGLENLVYPIMTYVSIMENILELKDRETIISIIKNSLEDLKMNADVLAIFRKVEASIRTLYENDINYNLTDLSRMRDKEKYLNQDLSNEYGVPVYDFSNLDYCLLTHVKSDTEKVENLVNGIATENQNNICLSAISYRNVIYYYEALDEVIFAYGTIPKNSFCQSSLYNMASNRALRSHSSEIREISRTQRGVLETSESRSGSNNEYLCFREGLVPMGIILTGGKEPSEEELKIAKEYNLPFIITQEYGKEIRNPEHARLISYGIIEEEKRKEALTSLHDKILEYKKSKQRRIAIFTDLHGMFEPALAILEDAKKRGITEIYSLGDNVGTGPNPKEVMNLLNEYGVKCVKGNHEGYTTDLSKYEEHLISKNAYDEAKNNSQYTRGKLSSDEMIYIENLPEDYTIEIGGKKVLLTHYTKDYNTDEDRYDLSSYDEIFQGHVHFSGKEGNVTTLKGAAIGGESKESRNADPEASYIILTETKDGYEVEKVSIPYNYKETYFDIEESELSDSDKEKIERWGHLR